MLPQALSSLRPSHFLTTTTSKGYAYVGVRRTLRHVLLTFSIDHHTLAARLSLPARYTPEVVNNI